ncbi:hypothetical protein SmJEL517_g02642 [Synchytrium microbalum]|uniref:Uncharacterized protein n=1 Tax=Synchytrium microbalum TaxID=1806994 RepID=A0A507C5M8_9FUNG|nr:uncharacterized protein SmJEL517_g02642 [Synchytrium microbalum]TPX34801.1 hypothetical protein SmJEL517_g02642 [Synchytrium microbalum]
MIHNGTDHDSNTVDISTELLDILLAPPVAIPTSPIIATSIDTQPHDLDALNQDQHLKPSLPTDYSTYSPSKNQSHRKRITTADVRKAEWTFRNKLLGAPGVSFNLLPVHPLGIVDIKKPDFNAIPELADPPPLIQSEDDDQPEIKPTPFSSTSHVDPTDMILPILKRTATHINSLSWIAQAEQDDLAKIFMSEVIRRYQELRESLVQQNEFSSPQINMLMSLILEKVSDQSELALERCRQRRKQMDSLGVLGAEANRGRVCALYRLELSRRIVLRNLLASVMNDITHGIAILDVDPDWQQLFISQLSDLQDRLPANQHVDLPEDPEDIKLLHEKYRKERLLQPLETLHRHLGQAEREEIMKKYGTILSDLGGLLNSQPQKIMSQDHERARRTLRDGNTGRDHADDRTLTGASDEDMDDAELHLSTMNEFSLLMRNDPILEAHATTTTFNRRKHDDSKPRPPRKRYLPSSNFKPDLMTSYDYSIIDEIPVSAIPPAPPIPDYIPVMAPDGTVLRASPFRVSKRTPKGSVSIDPSPPLVVSEFSGMIDQAALEALDGRLARYKEVEELYDEVMKTLTGRNWQTDVAKEEDSGSCPAAPFEPGMPMSYAFQGLAIPKRQIMAAAAAANGTSATTADAPSSPQSGRPHSGGPEIRLRTMLATGPSVTPSEYLRNRKSAMAKTPSSRAATHTKFNFGGYVPADVADELRHPSDDANQVSIVDYIDYLKTRACDFILEIMVDADEDEEAYRRFVEEQDKLRKEEREQEQVVKQQKAHAARYERRRQMTSYSDGNWNPLIMEYFEELKNNEVPPELESDVVSPKENLQGSGGSVNKSAGTFQRSKSITKHSKPDVGSSTNTSATKEPPRNRSNSSNLGNKKSTNSVTGSNFSNASTSSRNTAEPTNLRPFPSMINIHRAQEDLRKIWNDLKMTFGEQCRMAAIYGSHRYSSKLEATVLIWKEAGKRVLEREAVLSKLCQFEKEASNPERLFGHGHDVSSEIRMAEASRREELLGELASMEEGVLAAAKTLKSQLKEALTYEGVVYADKMIHDVTDLIYHAAGHKSRPTSGREAKPRLPPIPDATPK